ncbi:putative methyltransferase [Tanacetum coccineum]
MAGLFDKQAEVADHYTQVIGTDISEHQLKLAKPHPRVRYLHTPLSLSGDDLIDLLGGESSVDLVTVAEAVHWFYDTTLPYWNKDIKYLSDGYQTLPFPFESVGLGSEGSPLKLDIAKELSFEGVLGFLMSWSAIVTAKEKGVDLLSENVVQELESVWGRHRIHANAARFHRPKGSTSSHQPDMKGKLRDSSIGNTKDNGHRDDVSSYANVIKNQSQENGENDRKPVLVLDDSCVNTQNYSCCLNGKVKEVGVLENLKVALGNESFIDIDLRYMDGLWVMIAFDSVEAKEKFLLSTRVYALGAIEILGWTPDLDDQNDEESDLEDEECEEVFKKDFGESDEEMKNNKEASTKESLEYPPGFTPRENDVENVEMDNQKDNCDGEFGNVNNISDEVNFSSGFNTVIKAIHGEDGKNVADSRLVTSPFGEAFSRRSEWNKINDGFEDLRGIVVLVVMPDRWY